MLLTAELRSDALLSMLENTPARSGPARRNPFWPRPRGQNGLLIREPHVAFCEWKFIGDRLQKSGTPKIGECVVGLFQFGLRYRARKIEFPIERRPFQSSRGNCDCFGEIAFAIVNGRELLRVRDPNRTGPQFLTSPSDDPRTADHE